MTKEKRILSKLCAPSLEWQKRYADNEYYGEYIRIADLGREVVYDIAKGRNLKLIKTFFVGLEEILVEYEGDIAVTSLIGAGLFEAMQAAIYHSALPTNLIEKHLGKKGLLFWGDIIEGWCGKGVRTVDAWKRILVSGMIEKVLIELANVRFEIHLTPSSSFMQTFPPLLFEQKMEKITEKSLLTERGIATPFGRIIFFTANKPQKEILIGNKISETETIRFAVCGEEIFTINLEKYLSLILNTV